ncbi:MAG: hypothetical protein ACKON8_04660, partial [Planctomycetota bacterium]
GTLSGLGKTFAVLGNFLPGVTTVTFSLETGLTLDLSGAAGSTFDITSPAFTVGSYDLVSGSGSMILGGPLTLAFTNGPYADGANVVQVFANTGGLSGNFSSVSSTGLEPGQWATFDASTGFVSVVPEPGCMPVLVATVVIAAARSSRLRRPSR